MGNREDLLAGARQCLIEKGYARTTARDIVRVSGTNLASIGYHFGSKEALLNEALVRANAEWGYALETALQPDTDAESLERFRSVWSRIVELFMTHRPVWAANFEGFAQLQHAPELRRVLADGLEQARGMATSFLGPDKHADERAMRAVGSFYQALLTGLMAQWLVDPEHAPSGEDLTSALRTIAARLSDDVS